MKLSLRPFYSLNIIFVTLSAAMIISLLFRSSPSIYIYALSFEIIILYTNFSLIYNNKINDPEIAGRLCFPSCFFLLKNRDPRNSNFFRGKEIFNQFLKKDEITDQMKKMALNFLFLFFCVFLTFWWRDDEIFLFFVLLFLFCIWRVVRVDGTRRMYKRKT